MKKLNNTGKIITYTTLATLIAIVIEIIMYDQIGRPLLTSALFDRIAFMLVLDGLVSILALIKIRLSSYITILGNLYLGVLSLGGLLQVTRRFSVTGLITQMLAAIGVVVAVAGLIQGIRQRLNYSYSHLGRK